MSVRWWRKSLLLDPADESYVFIIWRFSAATLTLTPSDWLTFQSNYWGLGVCYWGLGEISWAIRLAALVGTETERWAERAEHKTPAYIFYAYKKPRSLKWFLHILYLNLMIKTNDQWMQALPLDLVGDELASLCDPTATFLSLYDAGSDSNHRMPKKEWKRARDWISGQKRQQPHRISLHHSVVKC